MATTETKKANDDQNHPYNVLWTGKRDEGHQQTIWKVNRIENGIADCWNENAWGATYRESIPVKDLARCDSTHPFTDINTEK